MKPAILLTATVKAQAAGGNFTMDKRAQMYASTLRSYANTFGERNPIIFLENSN